MSSSAISAKLDAFHHFKKLPKELRDMIWKLAMTPRVVLIRDHNQNKFSAAANFPSGLHVCMESRETFLKHYRQCFKSTANTYINFRIDILHLDLYVSTTRLFLQDLDEYEHENLRYLALDRENGYLGRMRRRGKGDLSLRTLVEQLENLLVLYEVQFMEDRLHAAADISGVEIDFENEPSKERYFTQISTARLASRLGLPDNTSLDLFSTEIRGFDDWNVPRLCALTRWSSDTTVEVRVKASARRAVEDKEYGTPHGERQARPARLNTRAYHVLRVEDFFTDEGLYL